MKPARRGRAGGGRSALLLFALLGAWAPAFPIYEEQEDYLPLPKAARPLEGLLPPKGVEGTHGHGYLKVNSQYLKRDHQVDFDNRDVEVKSYLKVPGAPDSVQLWGAYYNELNRYSMDMNDLALRKLWLEQFIGKEDAGPTDANGNFLDLELPWKVPDWARRIGVDKPRLRINGSYKLVLEGRSLTGSGAPITSTGGWFPSFHMDQQPAFSVKGSIGRLINIEINNEEGFGTNLKDQMKITYKGEGDELEDDIIQEIEAGNTSLELPGTQLTGYTETHKGIFGLKMRMKFGGLEVTTIASQEGGSQERQKLGSSTEAKQFLIDDKNMDLYRHFFLSWQDRLLYADPDSTKGAGSISYRTGGANRQISVYVNVDAQDKSVASDTGSAYALDVNGDTTTLVERAKWKLLDAKDYYYDPNLRMLSVFAGNASQSIAVRWTGVPPDPLTAKYGYPFGDRRHLILLHSRTAGQEANLDSLMWRNVYSIGKVQPQDKDNFTLAVVNSDSQSIASTGISYARKLGLEKRNQPGRLDVDNTDIFDFANGFLILPCRSNADSAAGASHCLDPLTRLNEQGRTTAIYTTPVSDLSLLNAAFRFAVVGKQRKSTFDVRENAQSVSGSSCLDITPGTERLVLNGSTRLVKDQDYEVLYEVGQITLISNRAKDPNANIDVSYECTPAFQIQDKVLLGTHLEYKLDDISDESILGATLLWKSQSTLAQTPDLGHEPFNQLLWGFNARLTGAPDWMTKAANLVPFVQTAAKSKAAFEFELAQSRYNPNTKNVAFVDNFENSQNILPLPLTIYSWAQASPPDYNSAGAKDEELDYRHMGEFIWHSNLTETYSRIYGSTGNSATNAREQTLLKFTLKPNDNLTGKSWGGVMRAMSPGLLNQARKRALEVVVQGREGDLNLDLGEISEDLSVGGAPPDGTLESEVPFGATTNSNDVGLDGAEGSSEHRLVWHCAPACYADELDGRYVTDAGHDDWVKPKSGETDPDYHVDGTHGNNQGSGGFTFDTEDLDHSGILDTRNRYVRYTIHLDSACTPGARCEELRNGWRKYTIPLYDDAKVIDPTNRADVSSILSNVKIARLWMGRLPARVSQAELLLARVNLVGNAWEEGARNAQYQADSARFSSGDLGDSGTIAVRPAVSDSNRLKVDVVSNQEDPDYKAHLSPRTKIERSSQDDEPLPERALVLHYENLHPGEVVHATRPLGNAVDLTQYSRLRIEMRPQARSVLQPGQDRIAVGLRLGKDAGNGESQDYYEVRIHMDTTFHDTTSANALLWNHDSWMANLADLSGMKLFPDYLGISGQTVTRKIPNLEGGDSLAVSVVGNPSLAAINWMRLVIYVDSGAGVATQTGDLWVNDLRVEGVDKSLGTAMRAQLQLDFSDFVGISGNMTYTNGDFTTMSQTKATPAKSQSSVDYNTNFSLYANKFFPDQYGLNIPLTLQFHGSLDRPFTKPYSDIGLTGHDLDDLLGDVLHGRLTTPASHEDSLAEQAAGLSRAFQTTRFEQKLTASYRKDHRSSSYLTQIFFERPQLDYSYSGTRGLSFYDEQKAANYDTKLAYNLSPFQNQPIKPFGFAGRWKGTPDFIRDFSLTPYPDKLNLVLADLSYVHSQDYPKPISDAAPVPTPIITYQTQLSHGLDLEWKLLSFFGFGYRLQVNRDFQYQHDLFTKEEFWKPSAPEGFMAKDLIFDWDDRDTTRLGKDYFILANERNRTQSFHMDFNTDLPAWATSGVSFSSDYNHTLNDTSGSSQHLPPYFAANSGQDIKFTESVRLTNLMTSLSDGTKRLKGLSAAFDRARKFLDAYKVRSLDASYTVSHKFSGESFTYGYLDANQGSFGSPGRFYAYQFGFLYDDLARLPLDLVEGRTDPRNFDYLMPPDPALPGSEQSFKHTITKTADIGTGFTIPAVDLSLSGDVKRTVSYDLNRAYTLPSDTSVVWPELTLNATLNDFASRIAWLKANVRSITAASSYNLRIERTFGLFNPTPDNYKVSHKFAPFLRLTWTTMKDWRWEAAGNFSWDRGTSFEKRAGDKVDYEYYGNFLNPPKPVQVNTYPVNDSSNLTKTNAYSPGLDLSFSHDLETQKGIQFWHYYIKLQNNLRFKWTWSALYTYDDRQLTGQPLEVDKKIVDLTSKPEVSYSFTSNVDALAYVQYKYEKLLQTTKKESTHDLEVHAEATMRF